MKEEQRAEMERMEKLAAKIERNPLTKRFREDEAVLILSKRQEAAGKLETLRKEQAEVIPKLREVVKDKEGKYLRLKVDLDAAQDEINLARVALSRENNSFDADIRNEEAILFESADRIIDETIAFFRDKHEALMRKKPNCDTYRGETNIFTMVKTLFSRSNVAAIQNALAYCLSAICELESMKLIPALDVDRIEALKRRIPDIDEMTEVSGERPFPRVNTDPRSLLKSDSQLDSELGKLNEKFKKVMRK